MVFIATEEHQLHYDKKERKVILNLPIGLIDALGWRSDIVKLFVDPDENIIILKNQNRKAIGFLKFALILKNKKWIREKEKYLTEIEKVKMAEAENMMAEDSRKILYTVDWKKVNDATYTYIKNSWNSLLEEKDNLSSFPKDLKRPKEQEIFARQNYLAKLFYWLEEQREKEKARSKPKDFEPIEKMIRKYYP